MALILGERTLMARQKGCVKGRKVLRFREQIWSRRRESNPHAREGRQILSLLRLPVPPLRENCTENSMEWG